VGIAIEACDDCLATGEFFLCRLVDKELSDFVAEYKITFVDALWNDLPGAAFDLRAACVAGLLRLLRAAFLLRD